MKFIKNNNNKKNDKFTVKRKTKPKKKETKFLQSTAEIEKSNKQYYNSHQKSEKEINLKKERQNEKKMMRTTIATPDYGQCMWCVCVCLCINMMREIACER